ncbi:MAG: PLP-dependent aminotransferase family protein [Christensenellales bacterium]|jgi:2-aminoadipate transaminase
MDYGFAHRLDGITGSAIREIFKLLQEPGIISFAGGNPSADTFPKDELAHIASRLTKQRPETVLQYGITEGYAPLRETVANMVSRRGVLAAPSDVITLTGSSQGIDLAARVFLNPQDRVLVEAPTFLGALQTFRTYQAELIPVEMDDEGVLLEDLQQKMERYRPKFFYVIPTFQNPSGKTLSCTRRKRIAELAKEYGVMVIEDDPYGDLRYEGEPCPYIKSYDDDGRVLLLVSFSKIISPGLRVGAAVGAPEVLRKMVICKQGADTHTPVLTQAMVDEYVRQGALYSHIDEVCAVYKQKRNAMLAHMPEVAHTYTRPEGGLFLWGTFAPGTDAQILLKEAIKKGVAFIPGAHFYTSEGYAHTFRLNFSNASLQQIEEGMEILKSVVKGQGA